jgi:hypothetical protein
MKIYTETRGDLLTADQQKQAKARYVHRYTGQHRPQWSFKPRPDGSACPVQFKDDADWLKNTVFRVSPRGGLAGDCTSFPTWPNNPELRNKHNYAFQETNPGQVAMEVEPS